MAFLQNQIDSLQDVADYAIINGIKNLLFTGDLFHTAGSIKTVVYESVFRQLQHMKDLGLNFTFISGNHDMGMLGSSALTALSSIGPIIGEGSQYIELPDMPPIAGLDYTENQDNLTSFLKACPDNSIVMLHQGVQGVPINCKGFTLDERLRVEDIPSNILHAFIGHYHSHKVLNDRATISGALMQHNFGDAGDRRGFLDVELVDGKLQITQIESASATQFIVHDFNEVGEKAIPEFLIPLFDDFVRVKNVPITLSDKFQHLQEAAGWDVEYVRDEYRGEPGKLSSVLDMFEEYVKEMKLSDDRLRVGRELISVG